MNLKEGLLPEAVSHLIARLNEKGPYGLSRD
jgi:ankyrin repeat protein